MVRSGWVWGSVVALLAGCAGGPPDGADVLAAAAEATPPPTGDVVLHASGTLDKAAEGQGASPGRSSPGPFVERLAWTPSGAVAWRYHETRFDGTTEAFGEAYPNDTTRLYVIESLGLTVPARADDFSAAAGRVARRFPHALLADARAVGPATRHGDAAWRVPATLSDGTPVDMVIDRRASTLTEVSLQAVLPGRGPDTVRWWFADYRRVRGGLLPFRYGSSVGARSYTDMLVDSVGLDAAPLLDAPDGFRTVPVQTVGSADDAPGSLALEELAPSVYRVPAVRSGFAPLVVEVEGGLLVVDAPASFPMLGHVPPDETDPGPTMSWASERLVSFLGERFPDTPIRWVVLTHGHEDHMGGVRAFVAAGATVLAAATLRAPVERLVGLAGGTVPDRLASQGGTLDFRTVDDVIRIGNGSDVVEVVPVGDNPHADGMLVVRHPGSGIVYVSDLATPAPLSRYPATSHAALDGFLVAWMDERGWTPERVVAMHGSGALTPAHLDALRAR